MIGLNTDFQLIENVLRLAVEDSKNYTDQSRLIKANAALLEFERLRMDISDYEDAFETLVRGADLVNEPQNDMEKAVNMLAAITEKLIYWNEYSDFLDLQQDVEELNHFLKNRTNAHSGATS